MMILSNPRVITPRRDVVRVDSFYADPAHSTSVRPPAYQRLLRWPSSIGTDTVAGDPALIIDDRLGGWNTGRELRFNPNTQSLSIGEEIATIGVLAPAIAMAKYGEHGRNGAIIMTTSKQEMWDGSTQFLSGRETGDTTHPLPGIVRIRFIVDTTGHVDPSSFVILCRETPGAFLEPVQKETILGRVWTPARLHGRVVRQVKHIDVPTPIDSAQRSEDALAECG